MGEAAFDPSAEQRLTVGLEVPPRPAPVRVVLAGELDGEEVPRLHGAMAGVPGDGREVHIEAAGLTFVDSAGIRALLSIRDRAAAAGVRVTLGPVTRNVYRVLQIAGLVEIFEIGEPLPAD